MKKYFEKLQLLRSGYQSAGNCHDYYLHQLSLVVKDCALPPIKILLILTEKKYRHIRGNILDIEINGSKISISRQSEEDDMQDKITISQEKLIKFIDDWLEISKNRPSSITIWRDDQHTIWLESSGE